MKVKDRKVLAFFLYNNQYNFSSLHCKFLVDTTLFEHITMHSQLCYEKNVSSDGNKSTNINKTYELEIQVLAWDRHNNVAELNGLMGFQPLLIIRSQMAIHIYKLKKNNLYRFAFTQINHIVTSYHK